MVEVLTFFHDIQLHENVHRALTVHGRSLYTPSRIRYRLHLAKRLKKRISSESMQYKFTACRSSTYVISVYLTVHKGFFFTVMMRPMTFLLEFGPGVILFIFCLS